MEACKTHNYCWWKKSCITRNVEKNLSLYVNSGIPARIVINWLNRYRLFRKQVMYLHQGLLWSSTRLFHRSPGCCGLLLVKNQSEPVMKKSSCFVVTLPETNSSPLKIGHPKRKRESIPNIHFQVLLLLVSGSRVSSTGHAPFWSTGSFGSKEILLQRSAWSRSRWQGCYLFLLCVE